MQEGRTRRVTGGFVCTWAPTPRVRDTFTAAFPYGAEARDGQILVGSLSPVTFEPATWRARAGAPGVVRYFGAGRINDIVAHVDRVRRLAPGGDTPPRLNRDLFPRDEFAVP